MDGLLIDSEPFWREAEIRAFADVGIPLTETLTRETTGLREDDVVEHWFSLFPHKPIDRSVLIKQITRSVISLIKERGQELPGVQKIIEIFRAQGMPMAIASSSPMIVIQTVVEKLGIEKYLTAVHSAEHESHGKPHPAVYITAAKKLGIDPKYCCAFEDSPNGVLSAKAAKMKCIAVPDPALKDDKKFCIADAIIPSLEHFEYDLLEKI